MALSEDTKFLLLSALGSPAARDELVNEIQNIPTGDIADGAVTTPKIANSAVTDAKVASGINAAKIGSGSTTNAELGFVHGVTSAIQTQINSKQASGSYITALTGDVSASGPGSSAASIADATVTGKLITGFVSGAGIVTSTDTVLQAVNKLNGNGVANSNILSGVDGNSSASTPGTVIKKIEIFDSAGASLGFIAVYDSIT